MNIETDGRVKTEPDRMTKAELDKENTELAKEVAAERKRIALLEKQNNILTTANRTLTIEILKLQAILDYSVELLGGKVNENK